jgi:hypothetical protein
MSQGESTKMRVMLGIMWEEEEEEEEEEELLLMDDSDATLSPRL